MAVRNPLYLVVILSMYLYATSEALKCYSEISCAGDVCESQEDTSNREEITCPENNTFCFKTSSELMVDGAKIDVSGSGCIPDPGVSQGCIGVMDNITSLIGDYEFPSSFDNFEYILCNTDLCNTGSQTTTYIFPVIIGSFLFTVVAFQR